MTMLNLSGQVLGQYELREMLGYGGMGVAYRGFQRNLEREVAIKVLFPGLSSEAGYIERFYREAKTAASLEHSHIVPVYDYGVQGDVSYVVMRLLNGGTLEDRMATRAEQNKPLPSLGEISNLLKQLSSALDYAHSRGVIHRDIKPGNIMFDDQGLAYIVDFGIAKLMAASTSYTSTGSPIGTPLYMPPEQWRSEELTPAADQYAMAVTVYHLMTGRLPFESTTPYGMLHKHLHEEPTPPQTYREDLPYKVQEALSRALEKDPADRWESMTAFSLAFDNAARGQTGQLTGFFEEPVIARKKTTVGLSGPISISISPDSPLVTSATQAPPIHKQPVFWVMGAALLAAIAIVLVLLLTNDNETSYNGVMSPDDLRATVLAELQETQVSASNAGKTADAAVAFALTGTATAYTRTPTPDAAATSTVQAQATTSARGTQTQQAEYDQATADAGATETQEALLVIAQATADARATGTQGAIYDAATVTQEARSTSAAETQEALDSTATANASATENAFATATQAQMLVIAEATANARATGTQNALDAEATANAATATPTITPTPTPTPLPPDLRVVYNEDEFVLVNVSGAALNISQLVFESETGGILRSYDAVDWGAGGTSPATMRNGGCYQLVTGPATQFDPPRSLCPTFLGWFRISAPDKQFWLSARPNDTFTVRFADDQDPIATCRIGDGECAFALP